MSLFEAYLFLFFDSIMSCLILTPNTTMVYKLMTIFGSYNKFCMIAVALAGSLVGVSMNYILGLALRSVKHRVKPYKDSEKFMALSKYANRRLWVLASLSFMWCLGALITTTAGFLRISYARFAIAFLTGRLLYYIYLYNLFS